MLKIFNFFKKDPVKKLEKEYMKTMEKARDVLRQGDVQENARLIAEAEKIGKQIEEIAKKDLN